MFSLPGLPHEAITEILVFGLGFILFVSAMARLLRELVLDARARFHNEHPVLNVGTALIVVFSGMAMYFYVLAIAALLMESNPDIPNMAAPFTGPVLVLTDLVWTANEQTPMCLSWLGGAVLLHFAAELTRYVVGTPLRSRDKSRLKGALATFEAHQRDDASKEQRSAVKKNN